MTPIVLQPSSTLVALAAAAVLFSCSPAAPAQAALPKADEAVAAVPSSFAAAVAAAATSLPEDLRATLAASAVSDAESFRAEIDAALAGDPVRTRLVDKAHPLPTGWEPSSVVDLVPGSYQVSRAGHRLAAEAAAALEGMARAARADGITLVVSSAYRPFAYQEKVYARIVAELGQEAADRESARPGTSQHQTGYAVDFGSIDDSFALTRASAWLEANASRFGWSLSFPKGYEAVTGYRWESWHYRYVGPAATALIDRRFGGVQQYALEFLAAWKDAAAGRGAQE